MFLLLTGLFRSPLFLKLLGIFAIASAASFFTFTHTKSFYLAQGDSRVLKSETNLQEVRSEFEQFRTVQANRVRELELASTAQAASAAAERRAYEETAQSNKKQYVAELAKRKEKPGMLSSSAVDAINQRLKPDVAEITLNSSDIFEHRVHCFNSPTGFCP